MNLIINADDLGASRRVNDAIFEMIASGLITSSTLMANGEAAEDAAREIKRHPECSFGIHLNISEYKPLTGSPALGEISDWTGNFDFYSCKAKTRKLFSPDLIRAIYKEWCAQIEQALKFGIKISHLDSHHNIHVRNPQLICVIKCLQKKYRISKVRIRKNIYCNDCISDIEYVKSKALNYLIKQSCITTYGFTEFACFLDAIETQHICHESVELMVHPGNKAEYFTNEVKLLKSSWMDNLPIKINLISYNDL